MKKLSIIEICDANDRKFVRIENLKGRIIEMQDSFKALEEMLVIYDERVDLCGGFYTEMSDIIIEQKIEVQNQISNLQKALKSEVAK